jgi:CyaY protein
LAASARAAGAADKLDSSSVINIQIILAIMEPTTPTAPTALTDSEYHRLSAAALGSIEATVDRWLEDDVIDIDSHRTGGLLELSFPGGSKIIINTQPPLQEVWLAAQAGGYHYRFVDGKWLDTRDGSEFIAALDRHASTQAGKPLNF